MWDDLPLHATEKEKMCICLFVCLCVNVREYVCVHMDPLCMYVCVYMYMLLLWHSVYVFKSRHTYWTMLTNGCVLLYTTHRERALKSHLGVFTYTKILGKACDFYSNQIVQYSWTLTSLSLSLALCKYFFYFLVLFSLLFSQFSVISFIHSFYFFAFFMALSWKYI